jgi:hypothetical protein
LILSVTCSLATSSAHAGHGGHGGHSFGGASRVGGGNIAPRIQQTPFKGRLGSSLPPVKIAGGNSGPFRPMNPRFPSGPLNPTKSPTGPFKPPIGPFKPPVVTNPINPRGPIGPIKPPIGPIGPIKPPGGGNGGSGTGNGNGHHHRTHWPTIILGCLPCTGTVVGGTYCPPLYAQPVVFPTATPVVVSSAAPIASASLATDVAAASAEVAVEPAATTDTTTTDPATATERLPKVPVGSTLALQAKDLGEKTGQVLLVIDKLTLGVQIDEWAAEHTIATLPELGITQPTPAELVVVRADGQPASSVKVELVAAKSETATLADVRN